MRYLRFLFSSLYFEIVLLVIIAFLLVHPCQSFVSSTETLPPGLEDEIRLDELPSHPPGTIEVEHYDTTYINRWGANISLRVYHPSPTDEDSENGSYPLIVFCEGYMGVSDIFFNNKSMYYWLAENISSMGYVAITFDFQGQGDSEIGPALPPRYSQTDIEFWPDLWPWVDDINDTITWAVEQNIHNHSSPLKGVVDTALIGLMGHSTGASQSLVSAMYDARVSVYMGLAPYDNNTQYKPPYPSDHLGRRNIPVLLMVGTNDVIVPPFLNGKHIYDVASSPKEYIEIEGGGHFPSEWADDVTLIYTERWMNFFLKGDIHYLFLVKESMGNNVIINSHLSSNISPLMTLKVTIPTNFGLVGDNLTIFLEISNEGYSPLKDVQVTLRVEEVLEGSEEALLFNMTRSWGSVPGVGQGNASRVEGVLDPVIMFSGRLLMKLEIGAQDGMEKQFQSFYYNVEEVSAVDDDLSVPLIVWFLLLGLIPFVIFLPILYIKKRSHDRKDNNSSEKNNNGKVV